MRWRKVAILGVGLLGGSLGKALRKRGLAREVAGFVRREASLAEARSAGAVDSASTELQPVLCDADLVVLCTPVLQMAVLANDLAPCLAGGAIVTDVGSVKASVTAAVEEPVRRAGAHFVGSHPMAGSERTGVAAAREDLFQGAVTVVTPTARTAREPLAAVEDLWRSVGARVLTLSPERHDEFVSRTSHLPHFLAAALAHYVLGPEQAAEQSLLCASGFRDTTRVASGSPEMWRDIGLANREAILEALDGVSATLAGLRAAVAEGDALRLEAFLRDARTRRDDWVRRAGTSRELASE